MTQIAMFPLSDEELQAKSDELAAKLGEVDRLQAQKAITMAQFTGAIKQRQAEITQLAKEVRERQAEREASDAEAPWAATPEPAHDVAGRARRRRNRTGEVVDGE